MHSHNNDVCTTNLFSVLFSQGRRYVLFINLIPLYISGFYTELSLVGKYVFLHEAICNEKSFQLKGNLGNLMKAN